MPPCFPIPRTLRRVPLLLAATFAATLFAGAAPAELARFTFDTDPVAAPPAPRDHTYRVAFASGAAFSRQNAGTEAGWSAAGKNLYARALRPGFNYGIILPRGHDAEASDSDQNAVAETGSFFAFNFEPAAGKAFALTRFEARVASARLSNPAGVATDAFKAHFFLRSSLDGYKKTLAVASSETGGGTDGAGNTWSALAADLSKHPAFFRVTEPVTFRLYAYISTEMASSFQAVRIDDVVIAGVSLTP